MNNANFANPVTNVDTYFYLHLLPLIMYDESDNLSIRFIIFAVRDQSCPAINSNGDFINSSTGFDNTQYLYGQ